MSIVKVVTYGPNFGEFLMFGVGTPTVRLVNSAAL